MCRRVSVWLLLLPVAVFVTISLAGSEEGLFKVARVIDGDTIELENGERVRYIGIDTPETKHPDKPIEPFGKEAAAFNDSLVNGKIVRLETDVQVRDKYHRILAYVWVDSVFVNAELVKAGYAQVSTYPPNVKYQELFLRLQTEAREAGRGLWSKDISDESDKEGAYFVGSKWSDKFHNPYCTWAQKIKPEDRVIFLSVKDAEHAGYVPCKLCKPGPYPVATEKGTKDELETTVYITKTGSKYHRGTCSYLRKSKFPISLWEAKARGYTPCSRCKPPR